MIHTYWQFLHDDSNFGARQVSVTHFPHNSLTGDTYTSFGSRRYVPLRREKLEELVLLEDYQVWLTVLLSTKHIFTIGPPVSRRAVSMYGMGWDGMYGMRDSLKFPQFLHSSVYYYKSKTNDSQIIMNRHRFLTAVDGILASSLASSLPPNMVAYLRLYFKTQELISLLSFKI